MPLQPLLRRTSLQAGESLPSFLGRLELLNGYAGQDFLRQLCAESWPVEAPTIRAEFPLDPASLLSLAVLTGVPLRQLYAASLHFFANVLPSAPRLWWHPAGPRAWPLGAFRQSAPFGRPGGVAFCPRCLQAGAYHRLAWTPGLVTVCLQHRCLLRDHCLGCGCWLTLSALLHQTCWQCGANLTHGTPYSVAADAFGLFTQQMVQFWLGLARAPQGPWARSLPSAKPATLLAFFARLQYPLQASGGTLAQFFTQRPAGLPPFTGERQLAEDYQQGVQAMRALVQWPENWFGYLEVFRACYLPILDSPLRDGLDWEAIWQAFPFAQKALRQARRRAQLTQPIRPPRDLEGVRPFCFLPLGQAVRQTGLSQALLLRLAHVGQLHAELAIDRYSRERCWFLERESLEVLLAEWHRPLSVAEAATWLGLAPMVVLELLRLGLLQPFRRPALAKPTLRVLKPAVNACLAQVAAVGCSTLPAVECIDYAGALRLLGPFDLTSGRLIQGVLRAQWVGVLSKDWPAAGLAALGFRHLDLWAWATAEAQRRGWLTRREVAQALQLSDTQLGAFIAQGALPCVARGEGLEYFDRKHCARIKKSLAKP